MTQLANIDKWQVTLDLIRKYNISQVDLANVLGIGRSAVNLKLNPKTPDKFSDAQKAKITHYLLKMGEVLVGNLGK